MNDFLFGERYFKAREQLSGLMSGIRALADETSTDLADPAGDAEAKSGPFLILVVGEVNAGKSTFINGWFGHELCPAGALPETRRAKRYCFGSPERCVPVAPLVDHVYRPLGFLRDVEVVDTPGTNSAVEGHHQATAGFLSEADLVFAVFPVTNPWGAATWNFISGLSPEVLDRLVLVIQQADLREPGDIKVILGHMEDLALKRLGRVPPIFPVSGKTALQAGCMGSGDRKCYHESGYQALEEFISTRICQCPARRAELEITRRQAAMALRMVEDRIDGQTRGIHVNSHFIDQVEGEIGTMRGGFVARLPGHLSGMAEVFENEGLWVTRMLRRRLRALPSILRLFSVDGTGAEMEAMFIGRLQSAIQKVAEQDGDEVVAACRGHWQDLGVRVSSAMRVDLDAVESIDEMLAGARKRFVERLADAAGQGIGSLKVRKQLDKELRRRNLALRSFIIMTMLLTTAGATCGALGVPWVPWVLCTLALLFLTGGVLVAWITRRSVSRDFHRRLLEACGAFAAALRADYEEALRRVFGDYARSLEKLRLHLARERLAMEPRMQRWQELFLSLKAMEQDA